MAMWEVFKNEEEDNWTIQRDGLVMETMRGHYDAWEVMARAEQLAMYELHWKLGDPGGFISC